jgi:hypothetical protein
MVARDGVERFSALCNQQVADYTMATKDTKDSKDSCCVRFVCGFSLYYASQFHGGSNFCRGHFLCERKSGACSP